MEKERLAAFTDAVLAIIMTILVLELEKPGEATWAALWALRRQFVAYAITFFMLGAMWVNLHAEWQRAHVVDNRVVWWNIIMLFFVSLCPYVTSFVSDHFMSRMAQALYWIVSLLVTLSNTALGWVLGRANREDAAFYASARKTTASLLVDLGVKAAALVLAMAFYPPIVLYGVILSALIPIVSFHRHHARADAAQ